MQKKKLSACYNPEQGQPGLHLVWVSTRRVHCVIMARICFSHLPYFLLHLKISLKGLNRWATVHLQVTQCNIVVIA